MGLVQKLNKLFGGGKALPSTPSVTTTADPQTVKNYQEPIITKNDIAMATPLKPHELKATPNPAVRNYGERQITKDEILQATPLTPHELKPRPKPAPSPEPKSWEELSREARSLPFISTDKPLPEPGSQEEVSEKIQIIQAYLSQQNDNRDIAAALFSREMAAKIEETFESLSQYPLGRLREVYNEQLIWWHAAKGLKQPQDKPKPSPKADVEMEGLMEMMMSSEHRKLQQDSISIANRTDRIAELTPAEVEQLRLDYKQHLLDIERITGEKP